MKPNYNAVHFIKIIVLILFAGGLLFGYTFYAVSRGEAFLAFEKWCKDSKSIVSIVGTVKEIKMLPYDSFYEKNRGETGEAGFRAKIVGTSNSVRA